MTTIVSKDTTDDMHNWARWYRAGNSATLGFPAIGPAWRESRSDRAFDDTPMARIDDQAGERTHRAIMALPEREQFALAVHYLHGCSTWVQVSDGLKRAGIPVNRQTARELVERALLGVEMWLRSKAA